MSEDEFPIHAAPSWFQNMVTLWMAEHTDDIDWLFSAWVHRITWASRARIDEAGVGPFDAEIADEEHRC